jgi:hypothetical protein
MARKLAALSTQMGGGKDSSFMAQIVPGNGKIGKLQPGRLVI